MSNDTSLLFEQFLQSRPDILREREIAYILDSKALISRIERRIQQEFQQYLELLKNIFNADSPPGYYLGDVSVGSDFLNPNLQIKMFLEKLSGHILMAGATGAGKTNWVMLLLHQIQQTYPNTPIRYMTFASKRGCEQRNLIINTMLGSA